MSSDPSLPEPNEPDSVTGLTPKEKQLVVESWGAVKKDLLTAGVQVFLSFLKDKPEYHSQFSFADVPYEDLDDNLKVKAHGTTVMYTLSAIFDNVHNFDIMVKLLEKNAETHYKTGVTEKAYWDLKEALLDYLRKHQTPKFSEDTLEAWDKLVTVAFNVIIKNVELHRTNAKPQEIKGYQVA